MSKNKLIFLVTGIIIFLVRLAGDLLLYSLDFIKGSTAVYWHYSTTLLIMLSFSAYYFSIFLEKDKTKKELTGDDFFNSLYQNFVLSLIILLLVIFFSFKDTSALFRRSYVGLILADFFFLYVVIVTLNNFHFTYRWLWYRRHKLTKFYLTLLSFLILILSVNYSVKIFLPNLNKIGVQWLDISSTVLFVLTALITFLTNKKTHWMAELPRSQKSKFFWIMMLNVIIAIKLLMETKSADTMVFAGFERFYPLALQMLSVSFLLYGIYLFRLFMSLLAVIPSSMIVEKKSSEISSLAYLNKIVAEAPNNSKKVLIDQVTNLALQASSAYGAWTEIYESDNVYINTCVNINPENISELEKNYRISEFFKRVSTPVLIESVHEYRDLSKMLSHLTAIKSMIIIPLNSSQMREGTLIVFDSEDFSLEADDLKILTAFGDNVKIALDNSRLVKESIEKERFRNEMILARNMQQKLLPQTLPLIPGYKVSAFSIPATEVGGDYYDLVILKNGKQCILIGDVSGKGISAAFYMAQLKGVVLSEALESESAQELLSKINYVLYGKIESQIFVTMSAITFENESNKLILARAGHMPFLIKRENYVEELIPKGIGIGLAGKSIFDKHIRQTEITLKEHDTVIMFTDGLNEVRNTDGTEFGMKRIIEIVEHNNGLDSEELTKLLKNKVREFAESSDYHDDMTFISITKI